MKLKLLIAPLLVLLIIVSAIWVVVPAYKKLQLQKEELVSAEQKLTDIQQKNAMAVKLKSELDSNPAQKELVETYLPKKVEEESIIENLSVLAQGEGLVVSTMSVVESSAKNAAKAAVNNSQKDGTSASLAAENISVNLVAVGSYEKIKSFLGKLASLKRNNNVASLKIDNANENPGVLQADMVLDFSYFDGSSYTVNSNSGIFSKGFDSATVEQIKNKLSVEVVPVNVGTTGKGNIFLP